MREILFRGKGTSGLSANEWVYGYYCKDFWTPRKGHGILPTDEERGGYVEVDPSTVGQFTGLTDKNGKRIFEGDIVSATGLTPHPEWEYDSVTGVVEWCGGAFGVEGRKNDDYTPYAWLYDSCAACREIIGNIHDNPELLED